MSDPTRVVLLRGINVGGRNRLPMAELRASLTAAGFASVTTLLQSGNIVLRWPDPDPNPLDQHTGTTAATPTGRSEPATSQATDRNAALATDRDASKVASRVADIVATDFGLDLAVIALPAHRFRAIAATEPFPELAGEPKLVQVYFTADPVNADALDALDHHRYPPDRAVVVDGSIHAAYPNGMARSKLTNSVLDRAVGQPTTARNRKTVTKLVALLDKLDDLDRPPC